MLVLPRSILLPRNLPAPTPPAFTAGCLMQPSRVRIRMLLVLPRSTLLPRNQPAPTPPALTAGCLMQPAKPSQGSHNARTPQKHPTHGQPNCTNSASSYMVRGFSGAAMPSHASQDARISQSADHRPRPPCRRPALAPVTANRLMGGSMQPTPSNPPSALPGVVSTQQTFMLTPTHGCLRKTSPLLHLGLVAAL